MVRLAALALAAACVLTACRGAGDPASFSDITVATRVGDKAPLVSVGGDLHLDRTRSKVLRDGAGPAVAGGDVITFHYVGVDARTGSVFDSSYSRGQPSTGAFGALISGFAKGLVGKTVGSRVLIAIPPADGYGSQGDPDVGIRGTDTLVFVVDVISAR